MHYVYNYAKLYPLMLESSYPYRGYAQTCKYSSSLGKVKTSSYVDVTANSPSALMAAVV